MSETSEYRSNSSWEECATLVRSSTRVAIVTHAKPDGDALGSMIAVARTLAAIEIQSDCLVMGPLEENLAALARDVPLLRVEDGMPGDDYDRVFVLDTGAWSQLAPLEDWLRERHEMILGIDHHAHGDAVAARRVVDVSAASTTQMLVHLVDALGCPMEVDIAEPLFVGLATDTGWFKYANADAACFETAARLLLAGVDKDGLYESIESNKEPASLALEARALNGMEYLHDGAVVLLGLTAQDLLESGGGLEHLTGIVSTPMKIRGVRASILLVECEPTLVKVSLRSKPPVEGAVSLDVNLFAQLFGGGGHPFAAGARIESSLEEARASILSALAGWLETAPAP